MSYNSQYFLTLPNEENPEPIILEFFEHSEFAKCFLLESGDSNDCGYWFDSIIDLTEFSKKYPDMFFILTRYGEEPNDSERTYVKNGKYKSVPGKIVFETVSEKDLENDEILRS